MHVVYAAGLWSNNFRRYCHHISWSAKPLIFPQKASIYCLNTAKMHLSNKKDENGRSRFLVSKKHWMSLPIFIFVSYVTNQIYSVCATESS